ncbi:MAG: Formate dehydrogenase putative subunit, partial [Myxococcales bacterium]|nr:Formate dehydrogenase putative subunit [Myxococcales bacterium]
GRGEAAQMQVRNKAGERPVGRDVSQLEPTQALTADAAGPSYYDVPLLKEPVWVGAVPLYFFIGGAAGAASTLSCMARLFGGPDLDGLARRARLLGAAGDTVGAGLLIYDLGRPTRFLNMLRVFNPRSPMSVGSWVLSASGAANTGALLLQNRRGFLGGVGELLNVVGGVLGMPLAGYTAVLLSNTAVPVWRQARRSLPLLYMASGVAAAGSILSLSARSERERRVVERYAVAGKVGELAAIAALHREVGRESRVARPLARGLSGALLTTATVLTAASLASSLLPGSRRRARGAAVAGILGSLALRFAMHYAGKASARDPHASFAPQRRRTTQGMVARASET